MPDIAAGNYFKLCNLSSLWKFAYIVNNHLD